MTAAAMKDCTMVTDTLARLRCLQATNYAVLSVPCKQPPRELRSRRSDGHEDAPPTY